MNYSIKTAAAFALISVSSFAQDVKKEVQKNETKMDLFSSKLGTITKYIDTNLPSIRASYETNETRIRKVISGGIPHYFYQIEKQGKYSNPTASIEYSDLLEIIKAINSLKAESEKDALSKPDYLENKFTTVDGFQVGYYVENGKAVWFLRLEKFGSDNTLFPKDLEVIEYAFTEAKNKIEELKKLNSCNYFY